MNTRLCRTRRPYHESPEPRVAPGTETDDLLPAALQEAVDEAVDAPCAVVCADIDQGRLACPAHGLGSECARLGHRRPVEQRRKGVLEVAELCCRAACGQRDGQ